MIPLEDLDWKKIMALDIRPGTAITTKLARAVGIDCTSGMAITKEHQERIKTVLKIVRESKSI